MPFIEGGLACHVGGQKLHIGTEEGRFIRTFSDLKCGFGRAVGMCGLIRANNCSNLTKKSLPVWALTITLCGLCIRINGYQSQV